MANVLLVEPEYYSTFPPLGLLKLGAYHLKRGDRVEFVRGRVIPRHPPDIIYVTSLFTWSWRPVWEAVRFYKWLYLDAKVILGGIYATLLPEHAKQSGADEVKIGLLELSIEELHPAYELLLSVPKWKGWNGFLVHASRGCVNRCSYCAVWRLEPLFIQRKTIRNFVNFSRYKYSKLYMLDNNFLALRRRNSILDELEELVLVKRIINYLDFNQGLDVRFLDSEFANFLSKIRKRIKDNLVIRLALDSLGYAHEFEEAVKLLKDAGIPTRQVIVYCLYNFDETPNEFFQRVRIILNAGCAAYPMRYQAIEGKHALTKNSFIDWDAGWTPELAERVEKFRRIVGYGGGLPPYRELVNKFNRAHNFEEAFEIYPKGVKHSDVYKLTKGPILSKLKEKNLPK